MPVVLAAPLSSVVTFYLYWRDKFAAQRDAWRTPESVLHAASLARRLARRLAGAAAAAPQVGKATFRQVYWGTVALHWLAAGAVAVQHAEPAR